MTDPNTTPGAPPAADPAAPIAAAADTAGSDPVASAAIPAGVAATPVAATAPADPAATVAATAPRARLRVLAGLARLAQLVVMVAIFAAGVALGYTRFQVVQPVASTAGAPVTSGIEAPASVQGLVQALNRNDLEAARSSVPPIRNAQGELVSDPYRLLAGELRTMQVEEVRRVRALSTFVDGPRTATAIIISGRTIQGVNVSRHLIAQTFDGEIVSFR